MNKTNEKESKKEIKAPLLTEERKKEEAKRKESTWGADASKKKYGMWDFFSFTLPFLWKGGLLIKIQTILTFALMILAKGLNVIHPLILKMVIDDMTIGT